MYFPLLTSAIHVQYSCPVSAPGLAQQLRGRRQIFYGWWVVLVCVLGSACGIGPVVVYTFSIFVKPLAAELHTSRGSVTLAISLIDILVAFSAPGAGRLVDRHGARLVIVASHLAMISCLVGISLLRPPLWHFYLVFALVGLLGVATTPVTYSRVAANWFDRRRGTALGIAASGVGVGTFITLPLAQMLIDRSGWRMAYLGIAAFCLVVAVPTVWFFLRAQPQEMGLMPDNAAPATGGTVIREHTAGLTVWQALRTFNFWLLAGIFFILAACVTGANANIAPLLTDSGVSGASSALTASLFGVAIVIGRIGNGYLVDRFFGPHVMAAVFAGAAIAVAILGSGFAIHFAAPAAILLGLAAGAEGDLMPFLVSRYFGMQSMAEIYGCIFGAYTFGNATGRYLMAAGFDAWGSYRAPFGIACAALIIGMLACFALGKYSRSETASAPATGR
jgi:predicted MFS family arabinose efflux permease